MALFTLASERREERRGERAQFSRTAFAFGAFTFAHEHQSHAGDTRAISHSCIRDAGRKPTVPSGRSDLRLYPLARIAMCMHVTESRTARLRARGSFSVLGRRRRSTIASAFAIVSGTIRTAITIASGSFPIETIVDAITNR